MEQDEEAVKSRVEEMIEKLVYDVDNGTGQKYKITNVLGLETSTPVFHLFQLTPNPSS